MIQRFGDSCKGRGKGFLYVGLGRKGVSYEDNCQRERKALAVGVSNKRVLLLTVSLADKAFHSVSVNGVVKLFF